MVISMTVSLSGLATLLPAESTNTMASGGGDDPAPAASCAATASAATTTATVAAIIHVVFISRPLVEDDDTAPRRQCAHSPGEAGKQGRIPMTTKLASDRPQI